MSIGAPVAPSGGGLSTNTSRRVVRPDPSEAIAYARAVGRLVPAIEAGLDPAVAANRALGRGARAWTVLEPWREARRAFDRAVGRLADRSDVTLIDVRRCYGSIEPSAVWASCRWIDREEITDVLRVLDRFERGGVRGLPIGPDPSAILANAILGSVDRAIRRVGAVHVRWVDDVAIAGSSATRARAIEATAEALAPLGLALNERKTRVLPAETLRRSASVVAPSHRRA